MRQLCATEALGAQAEKENSEKTRAVAEISVTALFGYAGGSR